MKKLLSAGIALVLAAMLTIHALAMAVPTDTLVQNLNGVQQYIKTYTVPPDTDPGSLIEEPFDYDGYTYTYSSITKQENLFTDELQKTEVVTVMTEKKDVDKVLAAFNPTMEYDDGRYTGTLNLDHTTIKTEAAGFETRSYTVSATKEYGNLDSNDMAYVPNTTVKDGITIPLSSVDWQVQSTVLVGDVLVPATYKAVAYYSGRAYYSAATGYISTAEYKGTVVCSEVRDITYVVTYVGTPIAIPTETPVQKEDTDVLPTPEVTERAQIADPPERTDRGILPYVVGGAVLLAVLGGTTGVVVHSVRKRRENNKYEEDSNEEE